MDDQSPQLDAATTLGAKLKNSLRRIDVLIWDVVRFVFYELLWRQSGAAFICQKIRPVEKPKPQPTFFIYLFSSYLALFGLATQRHESHRDRIDNRIATLAAQFGTPSRDAALERINEFQNEMAIPIEPVFLKIWTPFITIFGQKKVDDSLMNEVKLLASSILLSLKTKAEFEIVKGVKIFQKTVPESKGLLLVSIDLSPYVDDEGGNAPVVLQEAHLQGANLQGANLRGAFLQKAYLQEASLVYADLQEVDLREADLRRADLRGADLRGGHLQVADLREAYLFRVNLREANLQGAYLRGANLYQADLRGANLQGAYMEDAKLENADVRLVANLTCEQLTHTKRWELAIREEQHRCGAKGDLPIPKED